MYSETENILNGKKKEKFRQRAIALRRVSFVLALCGVIKMGIAGLLWRDKKAVAHSVATLTQANLTVIQSNYLSLFILGLGGLLIVLAMIGCCTSRRLESNQQEEVRASRLGISHGQLIMVIYLMMTTIMFQVFMYATIWFTFFNEGPSSWMQNQYFTQKNYSGDTPQEDWDTTEMKKLPVNIDLIQNNIKMVLIALGLFCGLISFILYISMQLMKKLMKRMHRINTFVEIQAVCLAAFAVLLLFMEHKYMNFMNINSSGVITDSIPWEYHKRFFIVTGLIMFLTFFSFYGSYRENSIMLSISTMISFAILVMLIGLAVSNEVTSKMIMDKLDADDKNSYNCQFVIPQFSQDTLMSHGCQGKYLSYANDMSQLTCPKQHISRIWENNVNLLVQDQKEMYGCINTACCDQVKTLISSRFSDMTVGCITIAIFLTYFIINHQYMNKIASRYQARFLNHNGDCFYFFWLALLATSFVFIKYGMKFQQMGVPVANFDPVIPKDGQIYDYYGLPNPKVKKELKALELGSRSDPLMSYFKFADISKILPYSDPACPPDGICSENLQTSIKLTMAQDTDIAHKDANLFHLRFPPSAVETDIAAVQQLVLKNETHNELVLEGSIKQLKSMLKNNLVVTPACLFDSNIKVNINVMYADGKEYSDRRTRDLSVDITQIQKSSVKSELTHMYKYRFLHLNDNGDVVPIYDQGQTSVGGAGDLVLTFKGLPGSGFEFCEPTQQSLTRGSQYQMSFLPEMANGQTYEIQVKAVYKDFEPINYALEVKYNSNLDGKTRFIDLGTHIFYKKSQVPDGSVNLRGYNFTLNNVVDVVDDDIDDYQLVVEDGLHEYIRLNDQENNISMAAPEVLKNHFEIKVGENIARISQPGGEDFLDAKRKFFALPGFSNQIEIPLVSKLKHGELAVVLTWMQGTYVNGNEVEIENLDLHVEFQASDTSLCNVDFTQRQCNGVKLTQDSYDTDSQFVTVQAVKFDKIGDFDYMVYSKRNINKYTVADLNSRKERNQQVLAHMQVYSPEHEGPIYEVNLPFYQADVREQYWIGFCFKGGHGINSHGITVSDPNALYLEKPSVQTNCAIDRSNSTTISISPPTQVEVKTISQEAAMVQWEEPTETGGTQILRYRLFVAEKDSIGSPYSVDTADNRTSHRLRTPPAMQGKDYTVTVQAINREQKMSLVSEPAVFSVTDPHSKKAIEAQKAWAEREKQAQEAEMAAEAAKRASEPKKIMKPSPITQIDVVDATPGHIALVWQAVSEGAQDYKVYWDKGDQQQTALYFPLAESTGGANQLEVTKDNSGGIMGTTKLYEKGGAFNFKVSYIGQGGQESELSEPFFVTVKPRPLSNPELKAKATPVLNDQVKKKVQQQYEAKKKAEEIKKKMAAKVASKQP